MQATPTIEPGTAPGIRPDGRGRYPTTPGVGTDRPRGILSVGLAVLALVAAVALMFAAPVARAAPRPHRDRGPALTTDLYAPCFPCPIFITEAYCPILR